MDYLFSFLCFGLICAVSLAQNSTISEQPSVPCYDDFNRPQRCQPPFLNAAYDRIVEATNTCGVSSEIEYCLQTGVTGARKYCYACNDQDNYKHPASYLTDFNNPYDLTWWQSETMLEGVQYPTAVNLTLHLKKAFDITFVNLRFYSPRPESFAIFKRTSARDPWTPYQFYSASCEKTYGLSRYGTIGQDKQAICTAEFSDISPLTGGSVAFSTLEGRPNALEFNRNADLQDWVTATDIRIVLTRMNTFGDEVFGDSQVLKSYFYAVSDLAVGARCKCNGHASKCQNVRNQNLEETLECVCEHFTTGPDCGECLPFYNDQPWGRATESDAHECQACDCSGLSSQCVFDNDLYRQTGRGGRCINCRDNTDGAHCELCKKNHYRRDNRCLNCQCNPTGSLSLQCDDSGMCQCKPGVEGERCDRCKADFFDFGDTGCSPCQCVAAGSIDNKPHCDTTTGKCNCKWNVDGRRCNTCKPGFFGLSEDDPLGCAACFCYGHSLACTTASGYFLKNITSDFSTGNQRWTAGTRNNREVETKYNAIVQDLGVSAESSDAIYFNAPSRYLEDQRFSYNQYLTFDLRIGDPKYVASAVDIILEGNGQHISTHIFAQRNSAPRTAVNSYAFRIHENRTYQWRSSGGRTPRAQEIIAVLSNLTALKIRATYTPQGIGFIDNVILMSATPGFGGEPAKWVESCTCPEGYIGQFCESCIQGYTRDPPLGGPFARCVPCQCNNHSDSCDGNTGKCICQDNTQGDHCDSCARGYSGDATLGTEDSCTACPCPNGGPCIEMANGDVVCTECEEGYGGNLCDVCLDGFFGDPLGELTGQPSPCVKCACNNNIDPNAVGNCNTTNGMCLKCIHNTGGFNCENCLPHYYNNTNGQCEACNCFPLGIKSQPSMRSCDIITGQCMCALNVVGRQCERCEDGFWNITSGKGCQACDCHQVGSLNYTCEEDSGHCDCKNGITQRQCDACEEFHFGFSQAGCQACNCDPIGSENLACDENGYCECKPNVDGRSCDRCMENKQNIAAGCVDCPKCYDLVQQQVGQHRSKLRDLYFLVNSTNNNSTLFNDQNFVDYLSQVNDSVSSLLRKARSATTTGSGAVGQQLDSLRKTLNEVMDKCTQIARHIAEATNATKNSKGDVQVAEMAIKNAENALKIVSQYIENEGRTALKNALEALKNFGQNNSQMTDLARQATNTAKKQLEEADMIEKLAKKALETAEEAYRLANKSLNMPYDTRQDIAQLRNDVDEANRLYHSTKNIANSSLARAKAARTDALELFQEAQTELPSVDIDKLKEDAQKIKAQAEDIKNRSQNLVKSNDQLMKQVMDQSNSTTGLLNDGNDLLSNITYLLSEANNAKEMARQAVIDAETTMREANETLETLNDFDKLTGDKQAAEDALAKEDEIKQTIQDALKMTEDARASLEGVELDAKRALKLAKEAEEVAKMASKEAGEIRNTAQTHKTTVDDLKEDADKLRHEEIDELENNLSDYENQYANDTELAKKALIEAVAAKQKAKEAHDQVSKAHDMVKTIKNELENLGSVDLQQLRTLEAKLNMIEEELDKSDLKTKIDELTIKNKDIEAKVDQTQNDLGELRADVENIQHISESLPNECFKLIPIEKPAT